MAYGLRTETVLTMDGRDILSERDLRTLQAVRADGTEGAARELNVTAGTVLRRMCGISSRLGEKVCDRGALTEAGIELLQRMERMRTLLDQQMEHLWKKPTLTCDGLVVMDGRVLLVRRGRDPFKGSYALPGGIVEYGESTEDCVIREVREETGLETEVVRLVGVFSDPSRDPRGHFITALYELKAKGGTITGGDDADMAGFFPLDDIPPLAFDHSYLLRTALSEMSGISI